MALNPVFILGSATTPFGELWDQSLTTLAYDASIEALRESGVELDEVDLLIVSNFLASQLEGRSHLGSLIAEKLGLECANLVVEGACASGGLAVRQAIAALKSSQAKNVLVVGVEKMTDVDSQIATSALTAAAGEEEAASGVTFPGLYAIIAQNYLSSFGLRDNDLATFPVQAHRHAKLNPNAQFRSEISIDQVNTSGLIADPLRLMHCAPISDGASALVLSINPTTKNQVAITGSSQTTDTLSLAARESLNELRSVARLRKDLEAQGFDMDEVGAVELHDCFSITHALILEGLGLCKKGEAPAMVAGGFGDIESDGLTINPSGGLKACGHPIGATGVRQIHELAVQMRKTAGKRQVNDTKKFLAVNLGGTGATGVGHVVERIKI